MTAEYGAASQLEKIDMLDFADMVVLNKFEKRGAEDALRDVRKQWRAIIASSFKTADPSSAGVSRPSPAVQRSGRQHAVHGAVREAARAAGTLRPLDSRRASIPSARRSRASRSSRVRACATSPRSRTGGRAAKRAPARRPMPRSRAHGLYRALAGARATRRCPRRSSATATPRWPPARRRCRRLRSDYNAALDDDRRRGHRAAPRLAEAARGGRGRRVQLYACADREVRGAELQRIAESHLKLPKLAPPTFDDWGESLRS